MATEPAEPARSGGSPAPRRGSRLTARQRLKHLAGDLARGALSVRDHDGMHRVPFGPARGLRLDLRLPDAPVDMYTGIFEWEVWRHLREMLRPGHVAVDVGGHLGWYALVIARHTRAPVWSFEPDPEALALLRRNCAANPELGRHVIAHAGRCAAAGEDPEGEIALDALARAGEPPDLLKIDVDGPEAEVLAGAAATLRERRPDVVVETHSPALERRCGELLLDAGYRPLVVTPRRLLSQNRPGEQNRWLVAYGSRGSVPPAYLPLQRGWRLPRKAEMPSLASSLMKAR